MIAIAQGDVVRARALREESQALTPEPGHMWRVADALNWHVSKWAHSA